MNETIIIGAGQAGLSMGYYLKQSGHSFLILDENKEVGVSWKKRCDSLVLFTSSQFSSLPGFLLEGDSRGFPTKDEIANYLRGYAEKFKLPINMIAE